MSTAPAAIRIAQTVGITSAAFVAGGTLCISYLYIPSLLLSPNPLIIKQWKKSFDVGKIVHPGIALVSIAAYGYLAYQMKGTLDQHKAEVYGICAVTDFLIWPWTIFVTMPTNNKLFKQHQEGEAAGWSDKVSEAGLAKEETAHGLVQRWSNLNIVRGCFPLIAAALGTWATIS